MTLSTKLVAGGLAALVAGAMIALGYRHYTGLIDQVGRLGAERAQLELALATEKAAVTSLRGRIDSWRASYDKLVRAQDELARQAEIARTEARRLDKILARHDLATLARARPGLVERRLNAGTARAGGLLQCASTPGGCGPGGDPAPADERDPAAALPDPGPPP